MDWVSELYYTLREAWKDAREAADLGRRLQAWWWTVRHGSELDEPDAVLLVRGALVLRRERCVSGQECDA